jgi:putative redox protein
MAVKVVWESPMRFIGISEQGNKITMEPGPKFGGSGQNPTPLEVVAMALGACTGIDMVLVLEKMRTPLTRMEIEVETKRREEPPQYYEEIKLTYVLSGKGLSEANAQRAADLSHEKYCAVGAMLQAKAKITYTVKIV